MTTSKHDQNYFSISNNVCGLYEGTLNPQSATIPTDLKFVPLDRRWDATLKICDNSGPVTMLQPLQVAQGLENAVDMNNRAHQVSLVGDFGVGGGTGDQVITIKGGCRDIYVAGKIHSKGKNAEVVIGAYSDQCMDPCVNVDLSGLEMADGSPVRIISVNVINLTPPKNSRRLWFKSDCMWVYNQIKTLLVRTGLFKLFSKTH